MRTVPSLSSLARVALLGLGAWALLAPAADPARAELFGGVEFPDGERSFADVVEAYEPTIVNADPSIAHRDSSNATGAPDYDGVNLCGSSCSFVSLGSGGSLTVRFTDNVLTGSGNSDLDLWIFEVGPDVEDTFVEVSVDGVVWEAVGKVFGSTAGVDLDSYGFGLDDSFTWVRLTDDPNEGGASGDTVGADIDAVGAISSTGGCDVAGVAPEFPWSAGDLIQISGVGFVDGSVPTIDGVVAEPYTIVSSELIEATVPALIDGSYTLTVELANGQSCAWSGSVVSVESASWGVLKGRFD